VALPSSTGSLNPSSDLTYKPTQCTCLREKQSPVQWLQFLSSVPTKLCFLPPPLIMDPTLLSSSSCLSCAFDMPLSDFIFCLFCQACVWKYDQGKGEQPHRSALLSTWLSLREFTEPALLQRHNSRLNLWWGNNLFLVNKYHNWTGLHAFSLFFFFFVLLRTYTLSHSISLFLWCFFFSK
jgi:hypothetical protein